MLDSLALQGGPISDGCTDLGSSASFVAQDLFFTKCRTIVNGRTGQSAAQQCNVLTDFESKTNDRGNLQVGGHCSTSRFCAIQIGNAWS